MSLFPRMSGALKRATVAATLVAASAGASAALAPFTFDPGAAGLAGAAFTGDNLLISNYSSVLLGPGNSFSESGYLSVTTAQLGGSTFTPGGLNSTYGLYFAFTGTGTLSMNGDPTATPTFGTFSTLTYQIYGYNGTATFSVAGGVPTETAAGEVLLASGTLINGTVATVPAGDGLTFTPSASAKVSMSAVMSAFFVSPNPFHDVAMTAFSNTPSQVSAIPGGFIIEQGGGSINFATAVPEPETYAMLMAGLVAVGFVVRRRYGNSR